ncbi:hypothetical protein DR999_PMT07386 [Platysternon megacephalum]|uniref:Uncharacterized protein n=1 Tax=Platysternon megacephalum TaxID=55544 RepID=A0A4D9EDX7_9SAUR|nr:hypothetical protein DR999_PMT07386 [Platysternon megacephalum]
MELTNGQLVPLLGTEKSVYDPKPSVATTGNEMAKSTVQDMQQGAQLLEMLPQCIFLFLFLLQNFHFVKLPAWTVEYFSFGEWEGLPKSKSFKGDPLEREKICQTVTLPTPFLSPHFHHLCLNSHFRLFKRLKLLPKAGANPAQ